jgi:hypothetical protein
MNDQPIRSPLAPKVMPESRRRALRGFMLDQVAASAPSRRSRRPVVLAVVVGAVVAVLGGGVAYSALSGSGPVTDHGTARCYTVAAYSAGGNHFPGTTVAMADSAAGHGAVTDAVGVCAALWRAGILQSGSAEPLRNPAKAIYPVPALAQCVLSDGSAAVFPGATGLCARLGLQAAQVGTGP